MNKKTSFISDFKAIIFAVLLIVVLILPAKSVFARTPAEIRNLEERTFAELNLKVRSILSKSENNVSDEVLKDIGKEIEKHYLKISNNLLIEILRYTLFTTSQSTATLQDNPGKYKFECNGKQIMKNENG